MEKTEIKATGTLISHVGRADLVAYFEMAYEAMKDKSMAEKVKDNLDISDDEMDRLFSQLEELLEL